MRCQTHKHRLYVGSGQSHADVTHWFCGLMFGSLKFIPDFAFAILD